MNSDTEATFALAQAVYSALGARLKTGGAGDLRAEMDEASLDLYEATGGKVRDIRLNGCKVGEIRVETADGFVVDDPAAYAAWCDERGALERTKELDWTRLEPREYDEAMAYLEQRWPQMVVETSSPLTPDREWMTVCGGDVFDVETGEQVPGLSWRTRPTKTVVRGCKVGGVPKKGGGWQFTPVATAIDGLPPERVVGLLMQGGE